MAVFAALTVLSAGISAYSNLRQQASQADAANRNAMALAEQQELFKFAQRRKIELTGKDHMSFNGRKRAMLARAGISMEGTALELLASDKHEQDIELSVLRTEGEYRQRILDNQISSYVQQARDASNPLNTILTLGSAGLNAYSAIHRNGERA